MRIQFNKQEIVSVIAFIGAQNSWTGPWSSGKSVPCAWRRSTYYGVRYMV